MVLIRFDISVTQILQTHARTDIVDIIFILRNAVQMIQPQNRDIQSQFTEILHTAPLPVTTLPGVFHIRKISLLL